MSMSGTIVTLGVGFGLGVVADRTVFTKSNRATMKTMVKKYMPTKDEAKRKENEQIDVRAEYVKNNIAYHQEQLKKFQDMQNEKK